MNTGGYALTDKELAEVEAAVALPAKMSDKLDRAVDELDRVEKMDGYEIDMGEWYCHTTRDEYDRPREVCAVCLAGCVLVGHLPDHVDLLEPMELPKYSKLRAEMNALNALREGNVGHAAWLLNATCSCYTEDDLRKLASLNCVAPRYGINPSAFKAYMRKLAAAIRAAGY